MRLIQPRWASLVGLTGALLASAPVYAKTDDGAAATTTQKQSENTNITPLERIVVQGQRYAPESITLNGEYQLSRDYLDGLNKGNGNITDMLLNLPGIQGSEAANAVDLQAEIRAQLLSISGAQPWQTGFYFDGVSNNSRIDPASSTSSVAQVNDVQGHPQATFINELLVDHVTVYDSNVPARFGGFTGGVVDVQPRQHKLRKPRLKLTYRGSESRWNHYRLIDERTYNDETPPPADEVLIETPVFNKRSLGLSVGTPIGADYTLDIGLNRTTSTITEWSLLQPVATERESISGHMRLSSYGWGFDQVQLSASYAPYEGRYILTDIRDSNFALEGGGFSSKAKVIQRIANIDLTSNLSYSRSDNSRSAPALFRPWSRAPGKQWGLNIGETPLSIEGGYGDIDKEQHNLDWQTSASFDSWQWGNASHQLELGVDVAYLEVARNRHETAVIYNSPYRDANLDCRGQSIDCIEQSYFISLDELALQLGGVIDLSNPVHLQAYQDNLENRGQFFRYRRVYPLENINVELQEYSAYAQHTIDWNAIRLNLGLRADYDDFLKNLNLAPRLQLGLDYGDSLWIVGANRYYGTNVLTYKIREQQRGYITQYRTLVGNQVQDWTTSSLAQNYRYRFDGLKTPYADEVTLAWKYALAGGVFSIKAVQRWQRDQITRKNTEDQGSFTEIFQGNEGSGTHQRLTLSYQHQLGRHGIWLHTSFTENESSADSYDNSIESVPEDEIVFFQDRNANGATRFSLMSLDDLTRRQADYSRPLSGSLSLRSQWHQRLSTQLQLSYVGTYESAVFTGVYREADRGDAICGDCELNALNYPVYRETERPARTLLNANIHYDVPLSATQQLSFSFEIDNLLNSRTHSVAAGTAGLETGRSFWFGVSYDWH